MTEMEGSCFLHCIYYPEQCYWKRRLTGRLGHGDDIKLNKVADL